ncbi:MAG TPA: carboxypeptidase-like regulatory domain-containing protein [Pirellulales bacterium]|jgi:5-hydroxyisourate hydrolase-like protein (transthyretin family)
MHDSNKSFGKVAYFFLLFVLFVVCSGCGSGGVALGTVSGHVTKGGKPAAGINVRFEPAAGGRASEATTNSDGYYELIFSADRKGAVLGQHHVTVQIKEKYNNQDVMTSPAKKFLEEQHEVQSGANTFDFAIDDKPAAK